MGIYSLWDFLFLLTINIKINSLEISGSQQMDFIEIQIVSHPKNHLPDNHTLNNI